MKKSSLTIALWMAAVFVSGILVGAFSHKLYTVRSVSAARLPSPPNHQELRKKYAEELRSRLNLDDAQFAQANRILDETHQRYQAMKEKSRPEAEQIKREQRQKMTEILSAPQQAEYEKLIQERDQKMKEMKKP